MTSKRSFINMLIEDLKRRIWPLTLSIIGFFFALPVLALIKAESHIDSLRLGYDNLASLQESYARYTLGGSNALVIMGLIIMAALNALHGMKYLHSRQEADFYGSIPVLRTTKFAAAYINGILIAIIPYIIMYIFAFVVGLSNGLLNAAGISYGIQTMLLETAGFLLIYSFIIIAAVLTGHTAVTVAAALVLLFVLWAYALLLDGYASLFFVTRYSRSIDYTLNLSPVTLLFKMLTTDSSSLYYPVSSAISAILCVLGTVALFFVSGALIKIRPAEAAGKAMAFDKTKAVIKIIIMVPAAMAFGAFFPSLSDSNSVYGWLVFGIVMGLILAHGSIEIIYDFDFKACIRHIPSAVIGAVITAAIVIYFVFDPLGYDTKLPDRSGIENAAVYLPGINGGSYYSEISYYEDISQSDMHLKNMVLTDLDDVYTLAEAGTEYAKKYRWHGTPAPETIAYEDTPHYIEMSVILRKKNGREFKRSYFIDRNNDANFSALNNIYDTDSYKKNTYEVFMSEDRLEKYDLTVQALSYESGRFSGTSSLSKAAIKALSDALSKETAALTLDYLKEEAPVGYISLNTKPAPGSKAPNIYSIPLGYVYPSFTETLSLLNQYGITTYENPKASEIDYIINVKYTDEEEDISERIDNRAEIERLLPELVSSDFASANYAMLDVDNQTNYEVHFKKPAGQDDEDIYGSSIQYFVKKLGD
ncbi:MAG: hypothetical protein IJ641_05215 [Lachnospiraceae bacterium]|nr:hypothetical protein [Lachnospiraceae bacterium]